LRLLGHVFLEDIFHKTLDQLCSVTVHLDSCGRHSLDQHQHTCQPDNLCKLLPLVPRIYPPHTGRTEFDLLLIACLQRRTYILLLLASQMCLSRLDMKCNLKHLLPKFYLQGR
jgi:hypothetical protein